MLDFKIFRGLSTELFSESGEHNLTSIEKGCWYLCVDTAELFLGVEEENGEVVLKQINKENAADKPVQSPSIGEGETSTGVIGAYIDETTGELFLIYSDGTEEPLGTVVGAPGQNGQDGEDGKDGVDGKDGLTTAIQIGETTYEHTNGTIILPQFATEEFVNKKIAEAELSDKDIDLEAYYTKSEVDALISEVPTKVSELENDAGYVTKSVFVHEVQSLSTGAYFTNDFTDYLNCTADKALIIKCGNAEYSAVQVLSNFPDKYTLSFLRDNAELVTITLTLNADYGTANTFKWKCEPRIVSKIATEQFVKDSIDELEIPETYLSNYYNKTEVDSLIEDITSPDVSKFITAEQVPDYIPETYVTNDELATAISEIELTPGPKGDAFTYEDFTADQLEALRGPQGIQGPQGLQGERGEQGPAGQDGYTPIKGVDYFDGEKGEQGPQGEKGDTGAPGIDGKDGIDGAPGQDYVLTEQDKQDIANLIIVPEEILFKNDKFVTTSIGDFKEGDNVSGLTVATLFAKLLGLSDIKPALPDIPGPTPHEHTEVVDAAVASTCTETGLTEGKHCSVCNEVLVAQTVVPALGHDEVAHEAKASTCTEIGWEAYVTCTRCDYTTYTEKAALGHTYGEWIDEVSATTESEGTLGHYHCSVCEKNFDINKNELASIVIPKLEHEDPDAPKTSEEIIDEIVTKFENASTATPVSVMQTITLDGELVDVEQAEIITFDPMDPDSPQASEEPVATGFYQIKDSDGEVIESGFQELQIDTTSVYYTIVLPMSIDYDTMLTIQSYNNGEGLLPAGWYNTPKYDLLSSRKNYDDVISLCEEIDITEEQINDLHESGYTLWISEDTPAGSKVRYIITNTGEVA